MGKSFLLDNAKKAAAGNQRSIRYLKELGLTAEEVNKWAGGNINEAGNEKIKLAFNLNHLHIFDAASTKSIY